MKICSVSSEFAPFAKTGGLADVCAALTSYLNREGHDVIALLPLYASIGEKYADLSPVPQLQNLLLQLGPWKLHYSVYSAALAEAEGEVYFIHCPQLYGRPTIYTSDWDEPIRFAFLARAAIEICQHLQFAPDVFHAHDWHAALIPLYLKTLYAWDQLFARSQTVVTIHNLGYQGIFDAEILEDLDLVDHRNLFFQEDLAKSRINWLKTGLLYANALTTVSRTYANEIQTEEHGFGLHRILRTRSSSLIGIVNGVDYSQWSPETDPELPASYSAEDLSGKAICKQHLLETVKLGHHPRVPTMGLVSRLTSQKGLDLLFDTLPNLLAANELRLVALGTGEKRYEEFLQWLQDTFPTKVCYYRGYSEKLAHLIEAGADVFLMPSHYEPCGLNQMYSLRYGTVPVVRKTGGLADTVEHFNPVADTGTGFVFEHFTPAGFDWALRLALNLYEAEPETWRRLQIRGMKKDYSWDRQGVRYVSLFKRLSRK